MNLAPVITIHPGSLYKIGTVIDILALAASRHNTPDKPERVWAAKATLMARACGELRFLGPDADHRFVTGQAILDWLYNVGREIAMERQLAVERENAVAQAKIKDDENPTPENMT